MDPQVVSFVGTDRINREVTLAQMTEAPAPQVVPGTYWVILRNQSSDQFLMPAGFTVHLLVSSEASGQWEEVEDRVIYHPENAPFALEPRGTLLDDELPFSVLPILDKVLDPSILRVIVVGEDPAGETVAAYVDIPLAD
jgi:hypothetical protein